MKKKIILELLIIFFFNFYGFFCFFLLPILLILSFFEQKKRTKVTAGFFEFLCKIRKVGFADGISWFSVFYENIQSLRLEALNNFPDFHPPSRPGLLPVSVPDFNFSIISANHFRCWQHPSLRLEGLFVKAQSKFLK